MILYIFNPQAKKSEHLKRKIKSCLVELGLIGEFVEARKIEDIKTIMNGAVSKNVEKVVAIGGDGMINQIVPHLLNTGIPLGIIPTGETNFLANMLGIKDWKKGCATLAKGKLIKLNVGLANDHYFLSSVEIEGKQDKKEGSWRFLHKPKPKYHPTMIDIQADGTDIKLQSNISSIMVSTIHLPTSPGFNIEEEMSKKTLNIIVKSQPITEKKKITEEITIMDGKQFYIQPKNPMLVKTDGENCEKTPIEIKIIPQSLDVIIPER